MLEGIARAPAYHWRPTGANRADASATHSYGNGAHRASAGLSRRVRVFRGAPRGGTQCKMCFATKVGSCPEFVKRGGLEVLPYFSAHGREGEAAPLLRRNLLMLLVQVAILMASRTLAKNQLLATITARRFSHPQPLCRKSQFSL